MRDVKSNIAGRLWKIGMGLVLIVVPLMFVQYLWNSYQRATVMDDWAETPCRIVSSGLDDTEVNQKGFPKYILEVEYTYEFEGESYTGDRVRRLPVESGDLKKVGKKLEQYPANKSTTCWVDPENPGMAVLEKDTKGALYSIWFPFLFVIGGLGMIVSALFRKSP